MRIIISVLWIGCCAGALLAREEQTRDFQKTAPLPAGRSFRLEHSLGNIILHTHSRPEAEIRAVIKCSAPRLEDAKTCAAQINIAVEDSTSGVLVRTEYPHNNLFDGRHDLSYSVNYDVTIPESAPLELRNQFGAVSVVDVHAGSTIRNANGKVSFRGGRGAQRIENSFGDVEVLGNAGDLTVVGGNGTVTANDVTGVLDIRNRFGPTTVVNAGKNVTVHSQNGAVSISNAGGVTMVTNSFGAVEARDIRADLIVRNQNGHVSATGVTGAAELDTSYEKVQFSRIGRGLTVHAANASITGDTVGESATVETTYGAIDLRGVKGSVRATGANTSIHVADAGGPITARTSYGAVNIEDAAGPVTTQSTNGSVTVRYKAIPKCQPIDLETTYSLIRVVLPPGLGYNLRAQTTYGRIQSKPPVTASGQLGTDSLAGKIAGGGCDLLLINRNGSIEIQ